MNTITLEPAPRGIALEVRALAAITSLIFEHYNGAASDPAELELTDLACDLADHLCSYFSSDPTTPGFIGLDDQAWQIDATMQAVRAITSLIADERDDHERGKMINRVSWLQAMARDSAWRLAKDVTTQKSGGAA